MKVFYGKWDSWGIEISYCHLDRSVCISFLHWYVGICFYKLWPK